VRFIMDSRWSQARAFLLGRKGIQGQTAAMNAYIGTVGPPSKKILVNDRGAQLPGDPWYIFQSGNIFTVAQQTPDGRIDARLAMLAPGVMRHSVVMSKDDMTLEIRGIFPPECGLRILQ
jgi:hypothetical protein